MIVLSRSFAVPSLALPFPAGNYRQTAVPASERPRNSCSAPTNRLAMPSPAPQVRPVKAQLLRRQLRQLRRWQSVRQLPAGASPPRCPAENRSIRGVRRGRLGRCCTTIPSSGTSRRPPAGPATVHPAQSHSRGLLPLGYAVHLRLAHLARDGGDSPPLGEELRHVPR